MSLYVVRPISDRTAFTGRHVASPFKAAHTSTLRLFERELRHLAARNVVVELDLSESDIRIDGQPRANARAATPAVRVAFDCKHGALTYATDRFWLWQDNLRAIALGLEALRKVDRYGITKRGEQYAGWKQLPAGTGNGASHMTRDDAHSILVGYRPEHGGMADAYRAARRATHPDRHDGDRTLWDAVEQAARVLNLA